MFLILHDTHLSLHLVDTKVTGMSLSLKNVTFLAYSQHLSISQGIINQESGKQRLPFSTEIEINRKHNVTLTTTPDGMNLTLIWFSTSALSDFLENANYPIRSMCTEYQLLLRLINQSFTGLERQIINFSLIHKQTVEKQEEHNIVQN